ncbi:serine hydrolase [Roseivirga sp. E12]|uniref:serine hydrolase domain-containing protein n=1 Tax=Roseivirga sp. E12 TaxID=2819237 RepID=UPI001ABCF84B|nr:serine hydrolase domain-containing protein [Roseivirga sp. E12]MBO3700610.1 beta-lactamase family protein [Roseivirga sp. E12]
MKRLFILLFALLPVVTLAQTKAEIADEKLQAFVEKTKVPGLSISISQKGELVYSKGFGYADREKKIPVDPSKSKFRIGSVSKTLTAAGLAKLYEEGKIDLDEPIQKYVPVWPDKGETITLRLLAGHLAGIRHYRGAEFMSRTKYEDVVDGLVIFINDPLINKPGTEYSYSSYGWNLISAAMENAAAPQASFLTSKNFLNIMQQEVFDALGMRNTVPDHADQNITNRTQFYQKRNGEAIIAPYVDNSYKWAGGGFVGTTEDLCKFGQAHMKAGYLKQSTLDEWMQSQKTTAGMETNYGIGWRTFNRPSGNTFYGHSGGSVGGITFFMIHPETETVLAIVGNMDPLNYGGLQYELMELFVK